MPALNITERKNKLLAFGTVVFITAVLIFILTTSMLNNNEYQIAKNYENNMRLYNMLFRYDETLHSKLNDIHRLDEQFLASVSDNSGSKKTDSLDKIIRSEEASFVVAVDSISAGIAIFNEESLKNKFAAMMASFRSEIAYRRALADVRKSIASRR